MAGERVKNMRYIQSVSFLGVRVIDCKRLERFFAEKVQEYLQYFEHFSAKNLFKIAARCHSNTSK